MPVLVKYMGHSQSYCIYYDCNAQQAQSMVDKLVELSHADNSVVPWPLLALDYSVTKISTSEAATLQKHLGVAFGYGIADVQTYLAATTAHIYELEESELEPDIAECLDNTLAQVTTTQDISAKADDVVCIAEDYNSALQVQAVVENDPRHCAVCSKGTYVTRCFHDINAYTGKSDE